MIKFYKDNYDQLSSLSGGANNICFAIDRGVILMGGKLYGKDQLKVKAGAAATVNSQGNVVKYTPADQEPVAVGTVFAFTADQSVWKYNGGTNYIPMFDGTLSSSQLSAGYDATKATLTTTLSGTTNADKVTYGDGFQATVGDLYAVALNLESKISSAYKQQAAISASTISGNVNTIIVSKDSANGGIVRTEYKLDNGTEVVKTSGTGGTQEIWTVEQLITDTNLSASEKNELSNYVPNAQTLAAVYEKVKTSSVNMATSTEDGLITWTPTSGLTGTTWTPHVNVLTGSEAGALVISNGQLQTNFAIRKIDTNPGYLASYALFNEAGGSAAANRVKLGDDINLVKDQFLKGAEYVRAIVSGTGYLELTQVDASNLDDVIRILNNAPYNAAVPTTAQVADIQRTSGANAYGNAFDRYLKLTFALTDTTKEPSGEGGQAVDPNPNAPSGTATDVDSVIYINVNELFDSYDGVSGITIDQTLNKISAQIDPNTETGLGATNAKHYNGAFLTTGADGIAVNGIKNEITGYIQDIQWTGVNGAATGLAVDQVSALVGNNLFLTKVGIDSNGKLTGEAASGFAKGINFETISYTDASDATARVAVTGTTVQDAFNSISNTIAKLDYSYNGVAGSGAVEKPSNITDDTAFIFAIEEKDGLISTSAMTIDTNNLKATSFSEGPLDRIQKPIYTISSGATTTNGSIQEALTSIVDSVYNAISAMDFAETGTKVAPAALLANATAQTPALIINQVDQVDGRISASTVGFDAANITFTPVDYVAGSGDTARVALTGLYGNNVYYAGTVQEAIEAVSKRIAQLDYTNAGTVGTNGNVTFTKPDNTTIAYNSTLTSQYQIIRGVSQEDGLLSAVTMDLTAANVQTNGVAKNLPTTAGQAVQANAALVEIASGNVQNSLSSISNLIADYMSFHNADGQVI